MTREQIKNLPFHAWNCLTLRLERRDVDLVIKDDHHMKTIIKFLIYSLNTIDGIKDSAKPVLSFAINKEIDIFKKKTGQNWVSNKHIQRITNVNEQKLFHQIAFKYNLLRVRSKISFMAFNKC